MFCYLASALSCSAPLFDVVPELFRHSACVLLCSGYSTGAPHSVVPCSGVPAFIVCPQNLADEAQIFLFRRKIMSCSSKVTL